MDIVAEQVVLSTPGARIARRWAADGSSDYLVWSRVAGESLSCPSIEEARAFLRDSVVLSATRGLSTPLSGPRSVEAAHSPLDALMSQREPRSAEYRHRPGEIHLDPAALAWHLEQVHGTPAPIDEDPEDFHERLHQQSRDAATYVFDVSYATDKDTLKEGEVVAGIHRVAVDGDSEVDARLTAEQMVAALGMEPTSVSRVSSRTAETAEEFCPLCSGGGQLAGGAVCPACGGEKLVTGAEWDQIMEDYPWLAGPPEPTPKHGSQRTATAPLTEQEYYDLLFNAATSGNRLQLEVRPERGKWINPQVRAYKGSTYYSFELGTDGKWRQGYVSYYGNGEFVHGPGCDASGYVIRSPRTIKILNDLIGQGVGASRIAEVVPEPSGREELDQHYMQYHNGQWYLEDWDEDAHRRVHDSEYFMSGAQGGEPHTHGSMTQHGSRWPTDEPGYGDLALDPALHSNPVEPEVENPENRSDYCEHCGGSGYDNGGESGRACPWCS